MGVLLAFLSAVFSSGRDLFFKSLSRDLSSSYLTYASFLYSIPFYLLILAIAWALNLESFVFSGSFLLLVVLRALTDLLAEWSKMEAIKRADISFISNFYTLSPVFLLFIAPFITGDTIGYLGIVGVLIVTIGSFVIISLEKVALKELPWKAILIALCSSIAFTVNTCFDKLAVQQASPLLSGFFVTFLAAIFFKPLFLFKKSESNIKLNASKALWGRGFFETVFMLCKLSALSFLAPQYVSALKKVSLFISVIGGKVAFNEQNTKKRFFGALLIFTGIICILFDV